MQYFNRHSFFTKAISVAVVCLFLANESAYSLDSVVKGVNSVTLAPPVSTNSSYEIVQKPDGTYDVALGDVSEKLRNKWFFLDVIYLAGEMLKFSDEKDLERPGELLRLLINKRFVSESDTPWTMSGRYDIGEIEELREEGRVKAFGITLKNLDGSSFGIKVSLSGKNDIKKDSEFFLRDGTSFFVESDAYTPGKSVKALVPEAPGLSTAAIESSSKNEHNEEGFPAESSYNEITGGTVRLSFNSAMNRDIERQLDLKFASSGFSKDAVVKQVIFVSSRRQENEIRKRLKAYYGKLPATSFVYETPLGGDIAMEVVAEPAEKVKITRISGTITVVEKGKIKEAYVAGIRPVWWQRDPYKQIRRAFKDAKSELDKAGFDFAENVKRIWLYQKNITGSYLFFSERYQRLNDGRDVFFTEEGIKGRGWYPASTGIGMSHGSMLFECLAVQGGENDVRFKPLENPESTNAHEYDKENVLKKGVHKRSSPPLFSRGIAIINGDHSRIYISGTASVKGPHVVHPGDVEKQTNTTIENIGIVLSRDGAELKDITQLRVYVKNPENFQKVKAIVEAKFPHAPPTIYLHADVCRDGWLVEIEAVADKVFLKPERTEMAVRSFNHGAFTNPSGPAQAVIEGAEEAEYLTGGDLSLDDILNSVINVSRDISSLEAEVRRKRGVIARPEETKERMKRLYDIAGKAIEVDRLIASVRNEWKSKLLNVPIENVEAVDRALDMAVRANTDLLNIIENRIRFSEGKVKKEELDLFQLIEDIERVNFHNDETIKFNKKDHAAAEILLAPIDKISIGNALVNILTNAKQAVKGAKKPNVSISLERKGNEAVIAISDNGTGISKEDLVIGRHGLPRFASMNFTTKEGGTGLGTSEAWYSVSDHGGTIEVESELGKGTRFLIRLPLSRPETRDVIDVSKEKVSAFGSGKNEDGIFKQKDLKDRSNDMETEFIHAQNFRTVLGYMLAKEKEKAAATGEEPTPHIIAVGKSWLKGYIPGSDQHAAFNPLITMLTSYCEKRGIPFIVGDDEDLPRLIAREKEKRNMASGTKVVMLAGAKADGILPDMLNDLARDELYTIVGIDSREMTPDSYIRIMEILTIALGLSIGIHPLLQNDNMLILPPDGTRPIYIIVPNSEPMGYEELMIIYNIQRYA